MNPLIISGLAILGIGFLKELFDKKPQEPEPEPKKEPEPEPEPEPKKEPEPEPEPEPETPSNKINLDAVG